MNHEPLEKAELAARDIARKIKAQIPEGWGFVVILASFHEKGIMTYLSSIEREGCIKMLREMADKMENNTGDI